MRALRLSKEGGTAARYPTQKCRCRFLRNPTERNHVKMKLMKKHSKSLRLLSAVLALVMVLSLLPLTVFAKDRTQASQRRNAPRAAAEISYVTKTQSVSLKEGTFYRIVHIDCGRKYFTVAELEKIIDYAAKYNYTHVELAFGNDGLRFLLDDMSVTADGKTYGSKAVADAIKQGNAAYAAAGELTQAEMDTLIDYAASKNIGIIPMFDAPGHLQAVIRAMSALGISMTEGTNYCRATKSGTSYNWALYPEDVAGVNFLQALFQKYVNYFAGKTTMFNIAADECGFTYNPDTRNPAMSNARYNAYAKLVNSLAAMVQNAGMVALAFNDGIYHDGFTVENGLAFDTDIAVCYWDASAGKYAPAATLASKGFKIINTHNKWYYVPGVGDWAWFGYQWSKGYMNGEAKDCTVTDGGYTTNTGCMNAIWFDKPSQALTADIWNKIEDHIKVLATNNPDYFKAEEHKLVFVAEVPATCETPGVAAHWKCTDCNQLFADAKAEKKTTLAALTLLATGHAYGEPVWKWNDDFTASAVFTCANDAAHTQTVMAVVTNEVTTKPTCEGAGVRTYTAKVTFEGKDYTDAKTEPVAATGHAYGEPVWKWNDDFTASAVFTCANDAAHTQTAAAVVTNEVTTKPTCEEEGVRTYTAKVTFEGKDYTDVKTEPVAAAGHQPERKNAKDATCTDKGYTGDSVCKVCEKVLETGKQVDALGHEFKNGKCTRCGKIAPKGPVTGDSVHPVMLWVCTVSAAAAVVLLLILRKKQHSAR